MYIHYIFENIDEVELMHYISCQYIMWLVSYLKLLHQVS